MRVNLIALIPAYNEEAVIAKTIKSILDAGMRPDDVIVINDASIDKTAEIARRFGVTVFDNQVNLGKAGGVTNTLRIIFSSSRYKDLTHICFLDADTLVDSGYFRAVRKRLSDDLKECEREAKRNRTRKPISILCGKAKSIPHNYLTAFRACEYWISYAIYKPGQSKIRTTTVAPGCASTYSVYALQYVKWSEDTVVEDMDATVQVALAGGKIAYEPTAVVYTQDPSTLRDYIGQLGKRWYAGSWQVMGKHKLLWPTHQVWKYLAPFLYLAVLFYLAMRHKEYLSLMLGSVALTSYMVSFLLLQAENLHGFLLPAHKQSLWYDRVRLSWYCRSTHGEPFLYIGTVLYVVRMYPEHLYQMLGSVFFTAIGFAAVASWQERRFDILKYSPIFPFIMVLNLILFVSKIGNVFGRKKSQRKQWYSPQRYSIETTETGEVS